MTRRTSLITLGIGLAAAGVGAVAGVAAERLAVGRPVLRRLPQDEDEVPLGSLREVPVVVTSDDGTQLHVEVDEPEEPDPYGLTVVLSHGYALSLDSLALPAPRPAGPRPHGLVGPARPRPLPARPGRLGHDRPGRRRPRGRDRGHGAHRAAGAGGPLDGRHDGDVAGCPPPGAVPRARRRRRRWSPPAPAASPTSTSACAASAPRCAGWRRARCGCSRGQPGPRAAHPADRQRPRGGHRQAVVVRVAGAARSCSTSPRG